jgi:hypothetical protein
MTSDEQLKSAPERERPNGNAHRLMQRAQTLATNRTDQRRGARSSTAHDFDNEDDPGPAAA